MLLIWKALKKVMNLERLNLTQWVVLAGKIIW